MKNKFKTETLMKVLIILYLFIILFPFIWVAVTSFRPESEIWSTNALSLKGATFTNENYVELFKSSIFNSLKLGT